MDKGTDCFRLKVHRWRVLERLGSAPLSARNGAPAPSHPTRPAEGEA